MFSAWYWPFCPGTSVGVAADYVGSSVCRTCHPDIWSTFYRNPHYKGIASGKESAENTGCESCHGPGKAHVEARGGKATIVAFSELSPDKILDACLRCHSPTLSRANIRRSSHTQADVVCSNCHSISQIAGLEISLRQGAAKRPCATAAAFSVRAQSHAFQASRERRARVQCTDWLTQSALAHSIPHGKPPRVPA